MLLTLVQHQFKEWLRKPYWGLSLAAKILSGIALLMMAASAFFGSWLIPTLLEKLDLPYPSINVFILGCLIFLCIDLCIRLFALKLPGLNLLHYRLHNIPSSTLRRYILVVNKLNSFNLITLLLIIPALFQLADLTKGLGLLFVFILLLGLINYAFLLLKKSFTYNNSFLFLYAVPMGLIALGFIYFTWVLEHVDLSRLLLHPGLILGLLGFLALLHVLCNKMLKKQSYLDGLGSNKEKAYSALKWLGQGPIANVLRIDLLLILRNKRAKSVMILGLPMILLFVFQASNLSAEHNFFNIRFLDVMMGYILVSAGTMNYTQFMFSWDSNYFDFVLCAPQIKQRYLMAKFWLLAMLQVLFGLLACLAFVLIGKGEYLPFFFSMIILNMGFFNFIHLLGSTLNNQYLDLSKSQMMNYQGISSNMYVLPLVYFTLPSAIFGILYLFGVENYTGVVFAVMGIVGILLRTPIIKGISQVLDSRKYEMAGGFRKRT